MVSLRVVATGRRRHRVDLGRVSAPDAGRVSEGTRPVWFEAGGPVVTPVVGRAAVGPAPIAGPVIVETYDSTVVVPPGATLAADPHGNLVMDLGA